MKPETKLLELTRQLKYMCETMENILDLKIKIQERATGDYSAKKARAGKDIGKPGKQFSKIAQGAAKRYGSKERGEKVAGAVLAKLRGKR